MKDAAVVYSERSGWYLRGDYSYAWSDAGELARPIEPFSNVSIDNTWALGGGIGRYFGRGVRGDVNYEWRGSTDVDGAGPGTLTTRFDLKSSLLLANLYYDFRPNERFTPYVGIGVGAARHTASGGTIQTACTLCATYIDDSNWSAAGALMAGVGYRFLYLGDARTGNLVGTTFATPGPRLDDITAHELRVGLRWDIR